MGDNYIAPTFLTDEAKALNDRFYLILNEVVKSFPEAKLKPNLRSSDKTKTNKQLHDANMKQMLVLQNDYFLYKNDIMRESEKVLKGIVETDVVIYIMDELNKALNDKLIELKASSHSAEGLFDDTQVTRNELLYGNFFLFTLIAIGGFFVYKKIKGDNGGK